MNNFFKRFDLYGQRIELTYRKSSHFKTYFGAMATLFVTITMTSVIIDALIKVSSGEVEMGLVVSEKEFSLVENKFELAFALVDGEGNLTSRLDPKMGAWTV